MYMRAYILLPETHRFICTILADMQMRIRKRSEFSGSGVKDGLQTRHPKGVNCHLRSAELGGMLTWLLGCRLLMYGNPRQTGS